MINFLSKNPKLSLQKSLVLGALGLYVYKHIQLQKQGQLGTEPDLMLRIDKQKMFDLAEKQFKLNPMMRQALERLYDNMMENQENV